LKNAKKINSVIFGLGGREIFEDDIKNIYYNMIKNRKQERYVGCRE